MRKKNKVIDITNIDVDVDDYEKEIIDDYDNDMYESVENIAAEKAKFKQLAADFVQKKASVIVRISKQDILKIKRKSLETGIPYQTLMSSVLHQFAQSK